MTGQRAGMTLIELLVSLGAVLILTLAGTALLVHGLEVQFTEGLHHREEAALKNLKRRLTQAWLRRAAHAYQDESWLVIEGEPSDGGVHLQRLAIIFTDGAGENTVWTLDRRTNQWRETRQAVHADAGAVQSRFIGYAGVIWMDNAAGTWSGDEGPSTLRLRFPDAREAGNRQGFAIHALW